MHGISLSVINQLRKDRGGPERIEAFDAQPAAPPRPPIEGLRNLFGPLRPDQMFSAHDRMSTAADVPPTVRVLMRRLALRMRQGHAWESPDKPGEDNHGIPAGYTYLMQLIAHDLVESTISLARTDGNRIGFANARQVPLSLETIYGGGPDTCPQAYELSPAASATRGAVPRTRLRTGRIQTSTGQTAGCPFHDVGRARPVDCCDEETFPEPPPHRPRVPLTEALVADPRNDSHALLSQLTVLFHLLHNWIERQAREAQSRIDKDAGAEVQAYLRFACARSAVAHIYRRIIVNDLLPRILHPRVRAAYESRGYQPVDSGRGVSVEFSHGAFRFGHAMVRSAYRVNREAELPMSAGLSLSTQRSPGFVPVTEAWHVDWKRFFEVDSTVQPNFSRRIAPVYSAPLEDSLHFPALDGSSDVSGLASRDLISACFAGFWSVPLLFGELRQGPLKCLLPEFSRWHAPIRTWLQARSGDLVERLDDVDVDDLVADPPLPFFVLLEAAFSGDDIEPTARPMGGHHLGPLGSIIVAETILGAMRDHPIAFDGAGSNLESRLRAMASELIGDPDLLAPLHAIGSMPDLVRHMLESGALAAGNSG